MTEGTEAASSISEAGSENPNIPPAKGEMNGAEFVADPNQPAAGEGDGDAPKETSEKSGDRPEGLPENFNTLEDFVGSFKETQSALTKAQQEIADLKKGDNKETKDDKESGDSTDTKENGVDFTALTQEVIANGTLSDESRAKLKETWKGLTDSQIDTFVAGQKAQVDAAQQEAFAITETEDNYWDMLDWAEESLPQSEQDAFDQAIATGGDAAKLAIQGLWSKYGSSNGIKPTLVEPESGQGALNGAKFESDAQVVEAMNDPRYDTDPAYRAEVDAKLRNSDVFNVEVGKI